MKRLVVLILFFATIAHGHSKIDTGPFIRCTAEGATWFVLTIDNVVHEYYTTNTDEFLVDLNWLITKPGEYDITITPENEFGSGKEVYFILRVKARIWSIVPDADLIKEDPEYLVCFSQDLVAITKK